MPAVMDGFVHPGSPIRPGLAIKLPRLSIRALEETHPRREVPRVAQGLRLEVRADGELSHLGGRGGPAKLDRSHAGEGAWTGLSGLQAKFWADETSETVFVSRRY